MIQAPFGLIEVVEAWMPYSSSQVAVLAREDQIPVDYIWVRTYDRFGNGDIESCCFQGLRAGGINLKIRFVAGHGVSLGLVWGEKSGYPSFS